MKHRQRRSGRGMPFRKSIAPAKSGGWKATLRAFVLLVAVVSVLGSAIAYSIVSDGLSAHDEPSRAEEVLAGAMRRWATPRAMRDRPNPVQPTPDVINQALGHYADHCSTCHANDGSGDTEIGRGLYPKVPDMRATNTQSLTDGELFSIIEHGIRLTGMPAWGNGTPEGERGSWGLVHFVRRLPKLTPEEIERMESLNPKTPAQFKEDEETRRFLQGGSSGAASAPPKKGHQD
jgi:mono/diheme cytochrome c family protein